MYGNSKRTTPDAALAQLARHGGHERRVHGSAGSVGEHIYLLGGVWTVG